MAKPGGWDVLRAPLQPQQSKAQTRKLGSFLTFVSRAAIGFELHPAAGLKLLYFPFCILRSVFSSLHSVFFILYANHEA
jgi:hypothetical protein